MAEKYGYFTSDGSEFVVTDPWTPRPWVNYLTNGDYCALSSHLGGGFSFYLDHRFNSVLRRGPHQHVTDLPGRLVYLKDEETGEVWTANAYPIRKTDEFESRQGIGYTTISNKYADIQSNLRYFVPMGIDAEMWRITVKNTGSTPRKLSVYSMADFVLGNVALNDHESQGHALFTDTIPGDSEFIYLNKSWHTESTWCEISYIWPLRAFMVTDNKPVASIANRDDFLGPFREYTNPQALEHEVIPDSEPSGKEQIGVFQWRIELDPGEEWSTDVAVGVQPNEDSDENRAMLQGLKDVITYDEAWEKTQDYWKNLFSTVSVETPEPEINVMANYWNKLQLMVNFHFGRGPSYYHKGQYPAMRDSCQDAFGVIPLNPEKAKENIRRVGGFFYSDGRACGGCNRIGMPEGPSHKVDLPLWFLLVVADYVRETADWNFLDESIPLVDGGESTVYQKMLAGIDRMFEDSGEHGLPLIGGGDWNDAANRIGIGGKGESVWLGQFLYFVIHEIAPIMKKRGDTEKLAAYLKRAEELKKAVNDQCWDGEWFVRAFKDDGSPVGVKGQKEGYIWINSQTWAVISKISDSDRLNKCMDSTEKHLGTEYGLMNLAPAFSEVDDTIGIITAFHSGWKENAAVFSHASSFNVVARAMLGRGKDALDLFRRILPNTKDRDTYMLEPYVYAQFCVGPASEKEFGRGAYHWLTGTAAWMFRALIDYIIGVHPEFDGLRIKPAVDPKWNTFSVKRRFRGADYTIRFENPNGLESGVKEMYLDGQKIEGDLLPPPTARQHDVRVIMG